jgi:hypothetical protein
MLIKIPILLAVGYLWINTQNSILTASVWGVAILLFGLILNGVSFGVFLGAGISFLICFGILALLEYLEGSGFQWFVGVIGVGVLVFIA